MFKFLVLIVILCQGISEIFGQAEGDHHDELVPFLDSTRSSNEDEGLNKESLEMKGQFFYSPRQTFYVNAPSGWKWPTQLGNVGKEVRPDYSVINGIGAHKVHRRKLAWNMARQICVDEGGHLADIRTIEEMNAIKTLMASNNVDSAWVGFHDLFQEGDWITVLDEPLARMKWSPWSSKLGSNPDNAGGNEHCAAFIPSHDGLNDDNCGASATRFPLASGGCGCYHGSQCTREHG